MLVILEEAYTKLHSRGGKPPKLSLYDKLLISLQYLREYRTMEHIGGDYDVCRSAISDAIRRVEDTPMKKRDFSLPGKKALRKKTAEVSYLVVDVTESPVQRPKKRQNRCCSGKKKRYTVKTQAVINRRDQKIICVQQDFGRRHDFRLFKESIGCRINPDFGVDADRRQVGIQAFHVKSRVPERAGKGHPLSKRKKERNRRIVIEHVNAAIKVFRIFAYPYRNHLRRHLLRMSLVCGIINFERSLQG